VLSANVTEWTGDQPLGQHLEKGGVSRREFLEFCGQMAAILGLSSVATPRIVEAMESLRRPSVIWLQLQECTGCVESVIRSSEPSIGDLVLDVISLDYQHTLMAAAGDAAEKTLADARKNNAGKYLLVVTGSVPLNAGGMYTTIGGKTARSILEETAKGAAAVIAVGACAHWGSVQAAKPNPTGAVGVSEIIRDKPVVNIAGCPPIADVVTATVVHYLTFNRLPALDADGRPRFAYQNRIHDQCPRRAHYDAGQFVRTFDDDGARKGYCLYEVGCKGPATFSPCPIFMWNSRTSWPIGAGHPCIGCTERGFWDTMTPFYNRLPNVAGFAVEHTADIIGAALAVGALAGVAAHAAATGIYQIQSHRSAKLREAQGVVIPPPDAYPPAKAPEKPVTRIEE
jgi:hydrogenase small subunit